MEGCTSVQLPSLWVCWQPGVAVDLQGQFGKLEIREEQSLIPLTQPYLVSILTMTMRQTPEGNGSQIHANPFKSVQILLLVNFNLELYREEIPGNIVNCLMNLTNYYHLLINELGNCSTCMNLCTPLLM